MQRRKNAFEAFVNGDDYNGKNLKHFSRFTFSYLQNSNVKHLYFF